MERHCGLKTPDIKCLQDIATLPVWIIEYAWAQQKMQILEGLDLGLWPKVEVSSLNLEEPWRLRICAAQAWCIVRARDLARFPWVLDLLDATFRLLPTLVTPIKHMKIMYGLKTMIVMWMLRENQGVVNIVRKTIQLFPGRLPQYRGCTRREMFLMRKNQQEFKTLAQSLAMDQNKRQAYIQHLMQEQYGESYAQKLEDRLIHYLHRLDGVLPRETYIDQLLQKDSSSLLHEEQLLKRLLACEPDSIAASLNRILLSRSSPRCDSRRAAQREVIGPREGGGARRGSPGGAPEDSKEASTEGGLSNAAGSPGPRLQGPDEGGSAWRSWVAPCCWQGAKEGAGSLTETSNNNALLLEEEEEGRGGTEEENRKGANGAVEIWKCGDVEESPDKTWEETSSCGGSCGVSSPDEETPPLRLCSRHQRWVRNILHPCSEEDEVTSSPTALHRSSTSFSSEELSSSVLPLLPHSSPSPSLLQPPALTEPVPLLRGGDALSTSSSQDLTPSLLPQSLTPPDGKTTAYPHTPSKDGQLSGEASGVAFCTDPTGLPATLRRPHHITPPQPSCRNEQTPSLARSTRSTSQETPISNSPRMKQLVVRCHRLDTSLPMQSVLLPQPSTSRLCPGRAHHPDLHLPPLPPGIHANSQSPGLQHRPWPCPRSCPWVSAGVQAFPLQSWVLQPQVLLTRLPPQQGTLPSGTEEEEEEEEDEEDDEYSDLDVNMLYSSSQSGEDVDCQTIDPNYKPTVDFVKEEGCSVVPIAVQRDRRRCVKM